MSQARRAGRRSQKHYVSIPRILAHCFTIKLTFEALISALFSVFPCPDRLCHSRCSFNVNSIIARQPHKRAFIHQDTGRSGIPRGICESQYVDGAL